MKLYFMGVCGTAMGNAAVLFKKQGHEVYGADMGVYPPMSDFLEDNGIEIVEGYDPSRLEELKPDLVVVGNVISRGNPEIEWLLETRAFRFVSLPELLGEELLSGRKPVVVSGTHGKTTTTTLSSYVHREMGKAPGYLIGGVPLDFEGGASLGEEGGAFFIEGDEYDSAFFDKRSKFIHYRPHILIVNNLEFDHADIFRDLKDVQRTFNHVLRIVPKNGYVLVNGDEQNIQDLLPIGWTTVYSVGVGEHNDLQITYFQENENGVEFEINWQNKTSQKFHWNMPGIFNVRNASMALLANGLLLNPEDPLNVPKVDLGKFKGVMRRQQVLNSTEKLVCIEDFGHHPTALKETITSLKARYPKHELIACFEPRSNTASSSIFSKEFGESLSLADTVYIGEVHRKDSKEESLDTAFIKKHIEAKSKACYIAENHEQMLTDLLNLQTESDHPQLFCFFSNGSFGGIIQEFNTQTT